jgi:hypothetical protein
MTKVAYNLKQVYALVITTLSFVHDKVFAFEDTHGIDTALTLTQSISYYIDHFCDLLGRVIEKYSVRMNVASMLDSTYPELSEYIRSLEDVEFIAVIKTIMEENIWLLLSPGVLRMLLHLSRS